MIQLSKKNLIFLGSLQGSPLIQKIVEAKGRGGGRLADG